MINLTKQMWNGCDEYFARITADLNISKQELRPLYNKFMKEVDKAI